MRDSLENFVFFLFISQYNDDEDDDDNEEKSRREFIQEYICKYKIIKIDCQS